jgi:molybdopterin synthase catalytic subunit
MHSTPQPNRMTISIQTEDFNVGLELEALKNASTRTGAIVSFTGLVRDMSGCDAIQNITLEHYSGMTEKALEKIVEEAAARYHLIAARVVHRIGTLQPGEQIVLVAASSEHRADAFAATEFIIDYLKTAAPFWKREQTQNGAHWVETKTSDVQRMEKWTPPR